MGQAGDFWRPDSAAGIASLIALVIGGVVVYGALVWGLGVVTRRVNFAKRCAPRRRRRPPTALDRSGASRDNGRRGDGPCATPMDDNDGSNFSGVQPTGNLHLGNYLGAICNWARLQADFECIYCLVDLHAITVPQDPAELRQATREATAGLLAAGIDPVSSIIFNQSQVSAHAELAWVFNCVARIGWLNRMTQFKEKAGKSRPSDRRSL